MKYQVETVEEAQEKVQDELNRKIKGRYDGLVIEDKTKRGISHFIGHITNMTMRNHNTEIWINKEMRIKLEYHPDKVSADFYFKIITDIMKTQKD